VLGAGLYDVRQALQFDPADRNRVRLDTSKMSMVDAKERCSVKHVALFKDAHENVRLEQWAPAGEIELEPDGGLEVLVLEGGFREGGETFEPQSWLRLPIGRRFSARVAGGGCRVWVKEGHLRHIRPVQAAD
jgi:hypothetical protein